MYFILCLLTFPVILVTTILILIETNIVVRVIELLQGTRHRLILKYLRTDENKLVKVSQNTITGLPKNKAKEISFRSNGKIEKKLNAEAEIALISGSIFRQTAISEMTYNTVVRTDRAASGYFLVNSYLKKAKSKKQKLNKISLTVDMPELSGIDFGEGDLIPYSRVAGWFLALYENLTWIEMVKNLTKSFETVYNKEPLVAAYRAINSLRPSKTDKIFVALSTAYKSSISILKEELKDYKDLTFVFLDENVLNLKNITGLVVVGNNNFNMQCFQNPEGIISAALEYRGENKFQAVTEATYYMDGVKSAAVCFGTEPMVEELNQ